MSSSANAKGGEKPKRIGYYRDYLTPTLHRRFTRAAGVVLLGCYADAVLISDATSYFWTIFPFSKTGVRALLLFISALVIFILRVAQLHIGERTATSPFNSFLQILTSAAAFQTFAFYLFSAWWFSEVYVWSASEDADLSWVNDGGYTERDQLNERPIFLRSNFLMLALGQSLFHLYYDYDSINIQRQHVEASDGKSVKAPPAAEVLKQQILARIGFTTSRALLISASTLVVYIIFLRQTAWNWSLWFARLVWDVSRTSEPSTIPPYHYTLLWRAATSSLYLMYLWELSNLAFSAYVSQTPMKRGRPLTSESRDPNASLLNGLKSKKNLVKTFAFWELDVISREDEARRKTIYAEYDRKEGSTWSQLFQACLDVIEGVNVRLTDHQTSVAAAAPKSQSENAVVSLPRLSAPLKIDSVLESPPKPLNSRERVEVSIERFAKSIGQSPLKGSSPLRQGAKLIRDKALTQDQQKALRSNNLEGAAKSAMSWVLNSPVGFVFWQTFDRRSKVKVFGSPRSEGDLIYFAVSSIAYLAVAAVKEDSMGLVNKDIALIMRTIGNLVTRVKAFMRDLPTHWTDPKASTGATPHVEEVEQLLAHLQTALKQLIEVYGKYARDMNLSGEEMRAAKMAAGLSSK